MDNSSIQNRLISTKPERRNSSAGEKRRRNCFKYCRKRLLPWASLIALLITWSGLFLFCAKVYYGLLDMEILVGEFFKIFTKYLRIVREGIVFLGIVMAAVTASMVIIGFFATLHCETSYRGRMSSCVCAILGSRFLCGLFWLFGYLLNLCWLLILMLLVLATSAYFCFLPICLPQTGTVDQFCFNFTLIASAISGGGTSSVSLILCGTAIDKFCKLTRAISVWYWGAYGGCLAVLLGLAHFNGSLAANFAHVKHAMRYRKIRRRTKGAIRWTTDWRIKSLSTSCLNSDTSRISTVSDIVSRKDGLKKNISTNHGPSESVTCQSDSSYSDSDSGAFLYNSDRPNLSLINNTTANGSIILHKRKHNDSALNPTAPSDNSPVSSDPVKIAPGEVLV